jgi:hypothetical protein
VLEQGYRSADLSNQMTRRHLRSAAHADVDKIKNHVRFV